jgi:hypothetical protein
VTVIGLFDLRSQTDAYFIAVTIPMAVLTISCSRRHGWVQPIFISKRQEQGVDAWWDLCEPDHEK